MLYPERERGGRQTATAPLRACVKSQECYIVNHAVLHLVVRFNYQAYHPTQKTIGYRRVLISTYESSKIADRSIIRLLPDQELSDQDLFFYDVGYKALYACVKLAHVWDV